MNQSRPNERSARRKRIFWLGMHKLLVQTELQRLRQLGFEVFNPAYLSDVKDQSAQYDWQLPQDCTLAKDVAEKLAKYNFFYNEISPEIAEILNSEFDAAIVTINPDWLVSFLRAYKGKVIYRVFGQPFSLSRHLEHHKNQHLIDNREDFWFVPHTELTTTIENRWLLDRMRISPYCLQSDVFEHKDKWRGNGEKREVGLLCPNITNEYYRHHYNHIKFHYNDPSFPIFGVQLTPQEDPQVVNTIERQDLLQRFRHLRAFLYHYRETTVAYLPPVEFMTIGGPVVHIGGSLLARFFEPGAPGCVADDNAAYTLARKIQQGDKGLEREIIASQLPVRQLYDPQYVWPIFDEVFSDLLADETRNPAPRIILDLKKNTLANGRKKILVPFHRLGATVSKHNHNYTSPEGVARVTRLMVQALGETGDYEFIVTSRAATAMMVHGYFQQVVPQGNQVKVVSVDRPLKRKTRKARSWLERFLEKNALKAAKAVRKLANTSLQLGRFIWRRLDFDTLKDRRIRQFVSSLVYDLNKLPVPSVLKIIAGALLILVVAAVSLPLLCTLLLIKLIEKALKPILPHIGSTLRFISQDYRLWSFSKEVDYVDKTNGIRDLTAIIVPHYYLFPEIVASRQNIVLYLPDHMPSIMPENSFENREFNDLVGKNIARKANAIITNSAYSAQYMPETELEVPPQKISVFPLPNLNAGANEDHDDETHEDVLATKRQLQEIGPFVFYPTQNRPNKRLDFLVRACLLARDKLTTKNADFAGSSPQPVQLPQAFASHAGLSLVLTCPPNERLSALAGTLPIHFMNNISDKSLRWLYKNSACLCFTSVAEGNFPTQILEALIYDVPIVATRMPLITSEYPDLCETLLLADQNQDSVFADGIVRCVTDRESVLANQAALREIVISRHSWPNFSSSVQNVFTKLS